MIYTHTHVCMYKILKNRLNTTCRICVRTIPSVPDEVTEVSFSWYISNFVGLKTSQCKDAHSHNI